MVSAGEPLGLPERGGRVLFVATILAGSFLLFLVQPMVARLALPKLGRIDVRLSSVTARAP